MIGLMGDHGTGTTGPKYSRIEYERKWLVRPGPVELVNPRPFSRRFVDRYLDCGRLRLRAMQESDGLPTRYKLTKKYASDLLHAQPVVSIFLSFEEYQALRTLPGCDLVKSRRYDQIGGRLFCVDVFEGAHAGLILCESEADSTGALARIESPSYALLEVTGETAYTGGALARARGLGALAGPGQGSLTAQGRMSGSGCR